MNDRAKNPIQLAIRHNAVGSTRSTWQHVGNQNVRTDQTDGVESDDHHHIDDEEQLEEDDEEMGRITRGSRDRVDS